MKFGFLQGLLLFKFNADDLVLESLRQLNALIVGALLLQFFSLLDSLVLRLFRRSLPLLCLHTLNPRVHLIIRYLVSRYNLLLLLRIHHVYV